MVAGGSKRAISPTRAISPPPIRRKVESSVTKKSVATFFTPLSQKKPEKITWRIVYSLVIGKYSPDSEPPRAKKEMAKVAAFDLDSTLVVTASGNTFPRDSSDWKWFSPNVPTKLKALSASGYHVVIITNQKRISLTQSLSKGRSDSKSLTNFKERAAAVMRQLDIPVSVYAATEDDEHRKPRTGMWREFVEDWDLDVYGVALDESFYVGDAAGRPGDHSTVDRRFAANVGIPFKTPEEFFLDAAPEPAVGEVFDPSTYLADLSTDEPPPPFSRVHPLELILFCGSPAAGKSTFYWTHLQPLGYERVNQDLLKTRQKCLKVARETLAAGSSVVVDNTNADAGTRAEWISLARDMHIPIRCVYFTSPPDLCRHNAAVRAANRTLNPESRARLPGVAFGDFLRRFREPTLDEGFSEIVRVDFRFRGDEEARRLWGQFWV
ncbi:putative DNA 3'-phosphatase Tpp1 [Aspergillus clavatus NRRL 1]|uniref:Polynucleotide kinase-3'-phosphatase n=1 Tax=Aspergillus clavatus (strain ATCC 1007 / CBS 513.65 / DSM 816 / NCTC 3887 / NRRL 1 / QM 1276 / 107) TaxID=344612 RepID=A1CE72_ASPCL|nr:polynucleotide kinase- 3'-phosphatase [Aspergillus clavatus NRRL 1]EAW11171.1 polynucleotide kinase- 3'-phosphatase [Aspergillus clavatus NRRL 1]